MHGEFSIPRAAIFGGQPVKKAKRPDRRLASQTALNGI
jgi:hypothetical protein